MRYSSFLAISALGLISGVSGALAGGYVAPVADPVVAAPVIEAAPVGNWAGGYAGGSIGYAFGSDDEIGLDLLEGGALIDRANDLGSVDLKGLNAGLHAGYRWQRGNWVFGPELWVEGGSIDASDRVSVDGVNFDVESSVNYIAGLQFKTGYTVDPQTLVYGTAGVVHGDFDYKLGGLNNSITESYSETGYSLGLGVERKLRNNLSVFAEWQYRNFGKTEVSYDFEDDPTILTRATPEHHNVKVGVNFSF
ncbi:outer membrane protein [Paracoccus sp. SY]|uniref:outer membrane protein n=1 Tax=Paracoccus sp. SY TaxID=1330255 RepID=UPI000CD0E145|nr:outer membrane beta-barrel protein [Paracoccus sp. SY]